MRKEIISIVLFFLVILIFISLISYSPYDPSINNTATASKIYNIFGKLGAHFSGVLIGVFGIGAFWIPLLLLMFGIKFLRGKSKTSYSVAITGSILLIISTGALLSLFGYHYLLFGSQFSSGGFIGVYLSIFLKKYANMAGALFILSGLFIISFILSTNFSLSSLIDNILIIINKIKLKLIKLEERKKKAEKLKEITAKHEEMNAEPVEINKPDIKIEYKAPPQTKQDNFEFAKKDSDFNLPLIKFLQDSDTNEQSADKENLKMLSNILDKKLNDFGVQGIITAITPGPVITTFEYAPAPGIKINKIVNLSDDLALALKAISIRIVAPIPGKAAIGIEIPNTKREIVRFKEIVTSAQYYDSKSKLTLCMGKDIVGMPVVAQLDKMPHLLIAGATGTGKSVALNSIICSILYKATPDEVRLIMIDPKRIELSDYNGIPHLITPVVTEVKKATNALFWAVKEMERRYELLSQLNARNIAGYNSKILKKKEAGAEGSEELELFPQMVIIIDELADLMMLASKDVEVALARLAQMARASGIHLILATQRPSVDVLTGLIKANFPTRMTFQVSSKTDSRTIIDGNGAENLLGDGDMLFLPPGTAKLQRIHGAYLSDDEISKIIDFLKEQRPPEYDEKITKAIAKEEKESSEEKEYDEKYDEAVALVTKTRTASISMVQRHLRVGYNRAARIIEMMEQEGVVGPADGVKQREVLVGNYNDIP
jgi:DNA segregation ATPase FtsK/SpoIIIE, S-DNA-T family